MGRKKKLTHEEILDLAGKGMTLKDLIDAGISDGGHVYRPEDSISTSVRMSTSELDGKIVGCGDVLVSDGTGSFISSGTIGTSGTISAPTWVSAGTSVDISPYPYISDERNLIFGAGSEKYNIKIDYNDAPVEMSAGQIYETLKLVTKWIGSYVPIRLIGPADKYPETLRWIMTDLVRNTAEKCITIIRKHASKEEASISVRLTNAIIAELWQPAADKCSDLEKIITTSSL